MHIIGIILAIIFFPVWFPLMLLGALVAIPFALLGLLVYYTFFGFFYVIGLMFKLIL